MAVVLEKRCCINQYLLFSAYVICNKGAEQQAAIKKLKHFPNQQDRGTHMNISCAV